MSRPGVAATTALAAALMASLAGCHAIPGPNGTGKEGPSVTPEQSRTQAVTALRETWHALEPFNVKPYAGASGHYVQCVDQGGAVEYMINLRVDPKLSTDLPLGGRIDVAAVNAGWNMESQATQTGSGTVSRGTKDNLTLRIFTYTDPAAPYALFELSGPCLDVGDADQSYTSRAAEDLPLT